MAKGGSGKLLRTGSIGDTAIGEGGCCARRRQHRVPRPMASRCLIVLDEPNSNSPQWGELKKNGRDALRAPIFNFASAVVQKLDTRHR
jgi:hypothetical protein